MLGDLMEDKRLDLAAPLLSVRRAAASSPSPPQPAAAAARRSALPFYKPELKSGPVRHPGAVPFVWEHRPGHPKPPSSSSKLGSSVRTRRPPPMPAAAAEEPPAAAAEEVEEIGMNAAAEVVEEAKGTEATDLEPEKIPEKISNNNSTIGEAALDIKEEEVKKHEVEEEEEEDEAFSDALDTLSRTESFFMTCSVSGLSGAPEAATASGGASASGEASGFMLDRFLPAAQAVAVGSPQYTFRKATAQSSREPARPPPKSETNTNDGDDRPPRRQPVPLPYQHLPPNYMPPNYMSPNSIRNEYEEEEEEDKDDEEDKEFDAHSTRHFAFKGCGLLPKLCMKSSFLLLNPVPAMKSHGRGRGRGRGRALPPGGRGSRLARSSQNGQLRQDSNEHSWEAVYKHKLGQRYQARGEDGRSKLTSESNQLTNWSDSQTGEGSSPFRRSTGGGASPYHSDAADSPGHSGKGSFGTVDREERSRRSDGSGSRGGDSGSVVTSDHGSLKGSGPLSPALERPMNDGSMDHLEDTDAKASHLCMVSDTNAAANSSEHDAQFGGERQLVEATCIVECQESGTLIQKIDNIKEPALPLPHESLESVKLDESKENKDHTSKDFPLLLEEKNIAKKEVTSIQSMLPLPLPKSPSESWLSRTLPSVSAKKPAMPSLLGIQVQPKKQAPWASMDPRKDNVKPSRPRQTRFAEVLEKPSLDSEI